MIEWDEAITEVETAKNFPKLTKDIKPQSQEILKSSKKDQLNTHIHTETHKLKTHTQLGTSQKICWKSIRKILYWKQFREKKRQIIFEEETVRPGVGELQLAGQIWPISCFCI